MIQNETRTHKGECKTHTRTQPNADQRPTRTTIYKVQQRTHHKEYKRTLIVSLLRGADSPRPTYIPHSHAHVPTLCQPERSKNVIPPSNHP
jgi:hypothetical protein